MSGAGLDGTRSALVRTHRSRTPLESLAECAVSLLEQEEHRKRASRHVQEIARSHFLRPDAIRWLAIAASLIFLTAIHDRCREFGLLRANQS